MMNDDERHEWAVAIGQFIIEFGSIESLVTEVVRITFLDTHFEILRRLPFEKRSSLALATLHSFNPSLAKALADDGATLDRIRARRNVVAHNGFVASIYTNEDASDFRIEFGMSDAYKKNGVFLQILHLKEDTKSLKEIYTRLLALLPSVSTADADATKEIPPHPPAESTLAPASHSG